ncbi:CPBP family intramembrane glutamic endopeptidase [Halobellus ordinarius]|uniref:CPBP family intramembrane glutamic endopeptidase n=1 Tax=Halobellus ordinarius TaxID=3075120 RepID=UPI00288050FD|nr:type II CAAX endopeptidase family protein [Halobellus sp. ZY16]
MRLASTSRLDRTAAPFGALSTRFLLVPLAPVALTALVITIGYVAAGGDAPGFPPQFPTLAYGVANVVVVALLYRRVPTDVWNATALFRRPSRREIAAGIVATAAGILLGWPATALAADALGVARYTVPNLTGPIGIGSLVFGAVIVAPVAEELLFRGLLVGILLERGVDTAVVAAGSLLVFAAMHVFTAGVGGVVNAVLLGALLTWLRFRFDNLVGAWLLHALNNLAELLVALSVLPSLYAL